jgi:hypothetical protein
MQVPGRKERARGEVATHGGWKENLEVVFGRQWGVCRQRRPKLESSIRQALLEQGQNTGRG